VQKVFDQEVGADDLAKKLIDHHPEMTLDNFFVVKHEARAMGYKSREELELAVPDMRIAVSHRHLIDVLFP
jgi:hypothetical protein